MSPITVFAIILTTPNTFLIIGISFAKLQGLPLYLTLILQGVFTFAVLGVFAYLLIKKQIALYHPSAFNNNAELIQAYSNNANTLIVEKIHQDVSFIRENLPSNNRNNIIISDDITFAFTLFLIQKQLIKFRINEVIDYIDEFKELQNNPKILLIRGTTARFCGKAEAFSILSRVNKSDEYCYNIAKYELAVLHYSAGETYSETIPSDLVINVLPDNMQLLWYCLVGMYYIFEKKSKTETKKILDNINNLFDKVEYAFQHYSSVQAGVIACYVGNKRLSDKFFTVANKKIPSSKITSYPHLIEENSFMKILLGLTPEVISLQKNTKQLYKYDGISDINEKEGRVIIEFRGYAHFLSRTAFIFQKNPDALETLCKLSTEQGWKEKLTEEVLLERLDKFVKFVNSNAGNLIIT